MPGWRIGFAVGNNKLIAALAKIKSYLDYGAFTPVQVAGIAALNGPQECVNEIRKIYLNRRNTLVEGFNRIGWNMDLPLGTMFVWAPIPERFRVLVLLNFLKFY